MNLAGNQYKVRHLLVIEDQKGRKTIPLEDVKYSLGRKSNNQIVLYSKQASRHHATLVRKSSESIYKYSYWILDGDFEGNKSNNGIYVNGQKCLIHELKDGDLINFGCDVNASYHLISAVTDTVTPSANLERDSKDSSEISLPNLHQKTTLAFSQSITNSGSDDTIHEQAYLDLLTELPNKALWKEYLSMAISNAKRNQKIIAVLLFDIDQFITVNNKYGYQIGDQVLQKFGKRLKDCVRSGDIVARYGGDEFAVLLAQINSPEDIKSISNRILTQLKQTFEVANNLIHLRINLGTVIYPFDGIDGKILLKKVTENLAQYKQQFEQTSRLQKTTIHTKTSAFSRGEYLIHQALDNEEFSLHYQPQVNINTGEIESMEALLRWQHPQMGFISPAKFLPLAEKTGLIIPINRWVIQTACQQNRIWQKANLLVPSVAVNLSPQQVQSSNFIKILSQLLRETGLEPHLLELEMTEASILSNLKDSYQVLQDLEQMGVNLSLDDFGLGYVSIGYLHKLPIKKLKIAQSLIQELQANPQNMTLIKALITLGRSFNLKVVAEGVETQQQLELLQELECEQMQGYHFSQPLPASEATDFLALHRTLSGNFLK